jgi:hypothetical protein
MENYDIQRSCPKCGHVATATVWHHPADSCDLEPAEHMHRQCSQCQYEWAEAPLS